MLFYFILLQWLSSRKKEAQAVHQTVNENKAIVGWMKRMRLTSQWRSASLGTVLSAVLKGKYRYESQCGFRWLHWAPNQTAAMRDPFYFEISVLRLCISPCQTVKCPYKIALEWLRYIYDLHNHHHHLVVVVIIVIVVVIIICWSQKNVVFHCDLFWVFYLASSMGSY